MNCVLYFFPGASLERSRAVCKRIGGGLFVYRTTELLGAPAKCAWSGVEWSDGNYISTIAFTASPSNKRRGAVWRLVIVFMRVFCILLVVLQQHLGMRARVRLIYFRLCASRFIGAKFVQARSHKYAFIGSECVPTPKPPHPDRSKSRY